VTSFLEEIPPDPRARSEAQGIRSGPRMSSFIDANEYLISYKGRKERAALRTCKLCCPITPSYGLSPLPDPRARAFVGTLKTSQASLVEMSEGGPYQGPSEASFGVWGVIPSRMKAHTGAPRSSCFRGIYFRSLSSRPGCLYDCTRVGSSNN
jgi:hypothetical protein